MSHPDLPAEQREEDEDDGEHPLKAGIEAAKKGDTASLDDVLADLE